MKGWHWVLIGLGAAGTGAGVYYVARKRMLAPAPIPPAAASPFAPEGVKPPPAKVDTTGRPMATARVRDARSGGVVGTRASGSARVTQRPSSSAQTGSHSSTLQQLGISAANTIYPGSGALLSKAGSILSGIF